MNEVVLAHPVWTAIGTYGGSLKSIPAVDVHGHIRDQCRSCASAIISSGRLGRIDAFVPAYDPLVERAGGRASHSPARAGFVRK
jgi:hypothetical protein